VVLLMVVLPTTTWWDEEDEESLIPVLLTPQQTLLLQLLHPRHPIQVNHQSSFHFHMIDGDGGFQVAIPDNVSAKAC
jgi:hypothetical protein